jgi:DNA-binding response OmpR family regulator
LRTFLLNDDEPYVPHSRPIVLVVEDDAANRALMVEVLKIHGFHVEESRDGQVALNLFKNIGPSLIIMDVEIPSVHGLEVCRRIRTSSNVPILMVTGSSDPETAVEILKAGADAFLSKPFGIDQLVQHVEELIGQSSSG